MSEMLCDVVRLWFGLERLDEVRSCRLTSILDIC